MKILHVIPSVGPARGGPSFVIRTLTQGLVSAGVAVDVLTTNDNGREFLDVPCGIPVIENGVTYRYFSRQTSFYLVSWPLRRWLAANIHAYHLVHIHALFSFPAVVAAHLAYKKRLPYIIRPLGTLNRWGMTQRRPFLKTVSFRLVERRILKRAAAVHYTSDQERIEAESLGISACPVIIPNTLQVNELEGPELANNVRRLESADGFRILFLSRLDRKKGLDLLLPAFALLHAVHPSVVLVIAGDGDSAFVASLKRTADDLGIGSAVIWTGFLRGRAKASALNQADAFVLPSYSENFGVAVLEAMTSGLPVVVTDRVPLSTEITETNSGIVVPCDHNALYRAMELLVADRKLCATLGANGQKLAKDRFSQAAVTSRLIAIYEQLLGTPRPQMRPF